MTTDALTNATVKAVIEALEKEERRAWAALFEADARLYDDGSPRSLEKFTKEALGHEKFTSIESVKHNGWDVTGGFHSDQWDFRAFFRFHLLQARSRAWISAKQPDRNDHRLCTR